MRVEGRSGIAGAEDEVEEEDKAEDCGVDAEKPVEDAIEDDNAVFAPGAPPLSHGFGGDAVAILCGAVQPSARWPLWPSNLIVRVLQLSVELLRL